MKASYTLYEEVQILLAGVRLFQHREGRLPSLEELAEFTRFSVESVHHLCNRLEKIGALERIRGAFDDRICLKESLQAEALREAPDSPDIRDDVQQWKEERASKLKEVEEKFSGDAARREKEGQFAEIEERLRKGGKEEKKSPLDDLFGKKLGGKGEQ
jgi:DNA-binding Lrp family transcriptional regulator